MSLRYCLPLVQSLLIVSPALAQSPPDSTQMETVTVTASAPSDGYQATDSITALKSNARLLETPQSVTVLTDAFIKDRDFHRLDEVLRYSAGVSTGGFYDVLDSFRIRGFAADDVTYLDGLKITGFSSPMELWGLERVEVVKGPASTLYGGASLGGLINMVSKRPQPDAFTEFTLGGGSYNLFTSGLDVNRPLSKNVSARVNAFYRENESFVDHVEYQRIFVAPSLTWKMGPDTSLTILTSYKYTDEIFRLPLVAHGTVLPNKNGQIPHDRFIGIPGKSQGVQGWLGTAGYEFNHQFNDIVSLRQNLRASWSNLHRIDILYPAYLDDNQRTLYLIPPVNVIDDHFNFAVDTAVTFKFTTVKIDHHLTTGVDYNYVDRSFGLDGFGDGELIPFDLFSPNYQVPFRRSSDPFTISYSEFNQFGLYIQEQAKFFDKLTLTLGVRYDTTTLDDTDLGHTKDSATTPRVGLTYEFIPGVAAYASYSRSFNPQWTFTDAEGNVVDPEEGENWEAGVKTSLLDGRLTASLAVYQLTRENAATDDLSTPYPLDSFAAGEQRARGVELESAINLAPGWDFIFAYSYTETEILKDSLLPVGGRTLGVPDHNINAWLKYTVQSGPLRGFGLGIGGRYLTSQAGSAYNTFDLPAYGIVDAALYYERKNFSAQINFNNVLDKRHFVGSYDELYVLPGQPFNMSASITMKF
ncbi:TonB-dependent siderophore receptor [Phragmitibacter flavus]|uniref:TonB-dependent siderophore receptor n=1 Tax=Phragmitibacter flavus TaxID=2576071 RepID=A0A5R8KB06_9BACT|nr:TonB-dependent siderophore receptor [Phragmitibacter flavus]TLD69494.1 TonB-dependent siderophore receptor [Phragmitibacter flavus]